MARGAQSKITVAVKADGTKATVKELESLNTTLAKTEKAQKKLGKTQDDVSKKSKKLSFATLEAARAFEDFQFAGVKGIVNNLSQMGVLLGGPIIGAISTFAVVGISQLVGAFDRGGSAADQLKTKFETLDETIANGVKFRLREQEESLKAFEESQQKRLDLLQEEADSYNRIARIQAETRGDEETLALLNIQDSDLSPRDKAKALADKKIEFARGAFARESAGFDKEPLKLREDQISKAKTAAEKEAVIQQLRNEVAADREAKAIAANNLTIAVRQREAAREELRLARLADDNKRAIEAKRGLTAAEGVEKTRFDAFKVAESRAKDNGRTARIDKLNEELVALREAIDKLARGIVSAGDVSRAGVQRAAVRERVSVEKAVSERDRAIKSLDEADAKKAEQEKKKAASEKAKAEREATKAAKVAAAQETGLVSGGQSLVSAGLARFGVRKEDKDRIRELGVALDKPGQTEEEIAKLINIAERILGKQKRDGTNFSNRLLELERFMSRTEQNQGSNAGR